MIRDQKQEKENRLCVKSMDQSFLKEIKDGLELFTNRIQGHIRYCKRSIFSLPKSV
jgi:hypothetical protein